MNDVSVKSVWCFSVLTRRTDVDTSRTLCFEVVISKYKLVFINHNHLRATALSLSVSTEKLVHFTHNRNSNRKVVTMWNKNCF
jgi:hypothetical protein